MSAAAASSCSSSAPSRPPDVVLAKEKKAATQLGVIVGAFILCWLPYFTLFMVVAYCSGACVDERLHTTSIWFGYFNSALNPILYPLCNANFKRAFKRMLRIKQEGTLTGCQRATLVGASLITSTYCQSALHSFSWKSYYWQPGGLMTPS